MARAGAHVRLNLHLHLLLVFSFQCCGVLNMLEGGITNGFDDRFPQDSWIDRNDFPEDFVWGSLTWAVKHEGAAVADGKALNIWDVYATKDGIVADGSIPNDAGGQYFHYKDDIKFLNFMGMDSYRFSIAWSRLLPNGTGNVNEKAVAYYNDLLDTLIEAGIDPYVALHEQDHPQALEDSYLGLLSTQFIDDFANYANVCFSLFGDRVKHWITFEEPNDLISNGYAAAYLPPGRCSPGIPQFGNCTAGNSSTEPYIAAHHALLAHAAAVKIYRDNYQEKQNGSIGLILWFRWCENLTDSSSDIAAAQRATDFSVGWFLDPIIYGDYPKSMRELVGSRLPIFTEEQSSSVLGSIDFLGINAATATYVTNDDEYRSTTGYFQDMMIKTTEVKDGTAIGPFDIEYQVPWCERKIVNFIKDNYNNIPVYITELGWGLMNNTIDVTLNDTTRVIVYATYLRSLLEGIRDGANVRGVFAWSLIDGFEMAMGLSVRFGLYFVDENFNRWPRLSALWFKEILSKNETTYSFNKYHQIS